MTFDEAERSILAGLADVLIPAVAGFLSAGEAGVAKEGLDQVLAVRPDLKPGLKKRLQSAKGREPSKFLSELQTNDPAGFSDLAELVAGAYFLNPVVCAGLHYRGQTPKPHEPAPEDQDKGLLKAVLDRGPIYRATPGKKQDL